MMGLTTFFIGNHRKFRFKTLECQLTCKQQDVNEGLFEKLFAKCFSSIFYKSGVVHHHFPH